MMSNEEIRYKINNLYQRFNEFIQFKDILRNEIIPKLQRLDNEVQQLTQNIALDKQQLSDVSQQVTRLTNDMQLLLEEDYEN